MLDARVVLAEFIVIGVLNVVSLLALTSVLRMIRRLATDRRQPVSPTLLVYLGGLYAMTVALIVVSAVTASAILFDVRYSPAAVFWVGVAAGALVPATPAGVFFITVERLSILNAPTKFNVCKRPTATAAALTIGALALVNAAAPLALPDEDAARVAECLSFACLASPAANAVYAANRLIVAVPSLAAASVFLVGWQRFRRRRRRASHPSHPPDRNDRMAIAMIVLIVLFEFIPSTVNGFLTYACGLNISAHIGPYRQFLASLNTLGCALLHYGVYRKQLTNIGSQAELAHSDRVKSIT